MAPIDKSNSIYRVNIRIKDLSSQSATFRTLIEAHKWSQITETATRERRYFPSTHHTLSEAIGRHRELVLPRKKLHTQADQGMQLT